MADIADNYATLERIDPSPLYALNRALALAEALGPGAGLAVLEDDVPQWLDDHYLRSAVLADLHRRAGHSDIAASYKERALRAVPTEAIRRAVERRLRED